MPVIPYALPTPAMPKSLPNSVAVCEAAYNHLMPEDFLKS
jgi:hypothetical protein